MIIITLLLLITIVLIFVVWLYSRWLCVCRYWSDRNVPHLPPHPILGGLTFLQKENPAIWMKRMYAKFRSPYVGTWVFWRPALIINSPEIARRVLVKDADVFKNRFLSSGKSDPIGALNLFTVNDPLWSYMRRRLTVVFTAAKLRALQDLIFTKTEQLITRIQSDLSRNKVINIRSLYADYTTDIIGATAFGVGGNATLTGESPLRKVTKTFMNYNLHRGLSWSSIFFFPELVDIFRFSFFPKSSTDYFRKVFHKVVEDRGGYKNGCSETKDLLDVLRKMKYEADQRNIDISEDMLVAQAAIFLFGGFDSTAVVLTFITYELAFHPDIQEKLYKELQDAKRKNDNRELDVTKLAEINYLNCVIKETMRIFPSMGWIDRISSTDYRIDDNLTISAGTPIYVNVVGMHYDKTYFPNPEVFDPNRFMPENEGDIIPFTFMPFGEGPRGCIGKRFAYQTIRSTLSAVIQMYKFLPLPGYPKPEDCSLEKRGLFLAPGRPLSVQFVPRY